MKTNYSILAATLFLSITAFAQKDELKSLKKITERSEISDKDIAEFKEILTKSDGLAAATESDKAYFGYYKSIAPYLEYASAMTKSVNKDNPNVIAQFLNPKTIDAMVVGRNTMLDFEKKQGKEVVSGLIKEKSDAIKKDLVNYAVALNDKKEFKDAALILNSVYKLDPKDAEKLYYAANFALNAKDYNLALEYFNELKKVNYTGESTSYYAKSLVSEKEDYFGNDDLAKKERNDKVAMKLYSAPRDEKVPSKKGEILKTIALIYEQNGKKLEAIQAFEDAKALNPEDSSLVMSQANLYYDLKDIPNYQRVIKEALEKDPNNPELYFSLGVTNSNAKNVVEAEKYFLKAIELKKDYIDAYVNLSEMKLRDDEKIVNEMSKLGNSDKDMKRYTVLKAERSKLFNSAIPYLEKAFELDPKNEPVSKTLLSLYKAMEMTEKVKELKAKM